MNKQLIAALAAAGLVTACSGPQTITQKVYEEKVKIVKEQIDETPKWMIELPKDEEAYYSAGTAQSSDLQMSIDMATINAKRTLADRIAGELSSQIKAYVAESGELGHTDVVSLDVEKVTKNVIANVNVAGYVPEEVKIVPVGTSYRTYVLLAYPIGEANRVLVDQLRKNTVLAAKIRSVKAFKELENEVDERREEELKELEILSQVE